MRGQYGERMSVDCSLMSTCCESIVTEVSRTWRGCNLQGWSCNWAAGSDPYKDEGLTGSVSNLRKEECSCLAAFICCSFITFFFFYDHHFCPHVTGHIKAIQHFTFCFNSKFTCSFCLCTLCLSITLLGVFLVLAWHLYLDVPGIHNQVVARSQESVAIYYWHIISSNLHSLYMKNEDNTELWIF